MVVVLARSEAGLSLFLVEPGCEGYSVTARESTLGLRALEAVTVEMDDDASLRAGPPPSDERGRVVLEQVHRRHRLLADTRRDDVRA